MITDPDFFHAWETEQAGRDSLSFEQKRQLVEAMYQLARKFGHFTEEDMLEGLDATVAMAEYMSANVRAPAQSHRPRT